MLGLAYVAMIIWNLGATWWLVNATVFGAVFAIGVNSLLMALVWWGYHRIRRKLPVISALVFFCCLWMSLEWLHLHWEFSWPWLNLGHGFADDVYMIQWYEYTGAFGGTVWVLVVNILIFLAFAKVNRFSESQLSLQTKLKLLSKSKITAALVLILIPIGISAILDMDSSLPAKNQNYTEVILLQPNIDPYSEKYYTDNDTIAQHLLQLAEGSMTAEIDFIISPETVLADNIELRNLNRDQGLARMRKFVRHNESVSYLGGVSLIEFLYDEKDTRIQSNYLRDEIWYNDFNSAIFMTTGERDTIYHKSKLVVGVENMPYKGLLEPILGGAMIDLGGTMATKTTQKNRAVFTSAQGVSVAPVICYESVYGEFVTEYAQNGAEFLAVITNDAWWGDTEGHRQHLTFSKLRAIENRRWVARSANTGISAIINDRGEIVDSLGYEKTGTVSGKVTCHDKLTFYAEHGDYLARTAALLGGLILIFSIVRQSGRKRM